MMRKINLYEKSENGGEINISELFKIFWHKKLLIFLMTISVTFLAYLSTLFIPNTYEAKVVLAPVNENIGMSTSQSFSSIASIAGINMPSSSPVKSLQALEQLSSFSFFENNIYPFIDSKDLLASKAWNETKNLLEYDDSLYDVNKKQWLVMQPSIQTAYFEFIKILSIKLNSQNGFITLSIEHESPVLVKDWLDLIVKGINKEVRSNDYKANILALEYLNIQFNNTKNTEIKSALADLIKSETKKMLLLEASEEYVYKILNPPYEPELPIGPNRILISIISGLIGFFISLITAIIISLYKKNYS